MIIVDMEKARGVWRDRMRRARIEKFKMLDIAFQRAIETGSPIAEIVAQKEQLRNVTVDARIEAATSTDDLKAIWPDCLR